MVCVTCVFGSVPFQPLVRWGMFLGDVFSIVILAVRSLPVCMSPSISWWYCGVL